MRVLIHLRWQDVMHWVAREISLLQRWLKRRNKNKRGFERASAEVAVSAHSPLGVKQRTPAEKMRQRVKRLQQLRMQQTRNQEFNELRALRKQRGDKNLLDYGGQTTQPLNLVSTSPAPLEPKGLIKKINTIEAQLMSQPMRLSKNTGHSSQVAALVEPHASALGQPSSLHSNNPLLMTRDEFQTRFAASKVFAFEAKDLGSLDRLNEAAMLFADGLYEQVEERLKQAIQKDSSYRHDKHVWLVLLDLHRVRREEEKFLTINLEYVECFDEPSPLQYTAIESANAPDVKVTQVEAPVCLSWTSQSEINLQTLMALKAILVDASEDAQEFELDWTHVSVIVDEACEPLQELVDQTLQRNAVLHHVNFSHLSNLAKEKSIVTSPMQQAWWLLRLKLLNWLNKQDLHERLSLQYCILFEAAPPLWRPPQCYCLLEIDKSASCHQSELNQEAKQRLLWSVVLSGEVTAENIQALEPLQKLATAVTYPIYIECRQLERLDFVAGTHLLNWVISRTAAGTNLRFIHVHRLLAQFLGMLGVSEHAAISMLE